MSLEKQSYLYEFLARFGPTGFQGAHQIFVDRIVDSDTGEVVAESLGPAMPVDSEAISEVAGTQIVQLLKRINDLERQIAHFESLGTGMG